MWLADRPDYEELWCERAEIVTRAVRAGAPWAEAVDEWTLAQGQPDWAHDYNDFELMYGDPGPRRGTNTVAQLAVTADLAVCIGKGY